jgi:hypothetical protein
MSNGLRNPAARDTGQLAAIVNNRLKRIQYPPARIDGVLARPDSPSSPEPLQTPACPVPELTLGRSALAPQRRAFG